MLLQLKVPTLNKRAASATENKGTDVSFALLFPIGEMKLKCLWSFFFFLIIFYFTLVGAQVIPSMREQMGALAQAHGTANKEQLFKEQG